MPACIATTSGAATPGKALEMLARPHEAGDMHRHGSHTERSQRCQPTTPSTTDSGAWVKEKTSQGAQGSLRRSRRIASARPQKTEYPQGFWSFAQLRLEQNPTFTGSQRSQPLQVNLRMARHAPKVILQASGRSALASCSGSQQHVANPIGMMAVLRDASCRNL
jgi:hypothetical protein